MKKEENKMSTRQNLIRAALGFVGVLASVSAFADWHTMTVTSIQLVATNNEFPSVPSKSIVVRGNFTPTLPCSTQAFLLATTDNLYSETYAMLLSAQLTSTPIRFLHIYCMDSGISRGNQYQLGT